MRRAHHRAGMVAGLLALATWAALGYEPAQPAPFAAHIERLSEPAGFFDTDNLISNEASYVDVIPALTAGPVAGGAYIGVGPDQNFTYIARIRPSIAYIIDIRRDNLLLHLLFKALFAEARTRAEYLSLLTGRPPPLGIEQWQAASIDDIVQHVDRSTPWPEAVDALRGRLDRRIASFGVPLSDRDLATIARFHRTFVAEGLDLVFASHGSPPRVHGAPSRYPNFRELLLAGDRERRRWNYLASEESFAFVKGLQARDAIVPVVGDLSGPHALKAIGEDVAARRERISAIYVSNVEFYLAQNGTLGRFVENLSRLPRDARSVLIRSIFSGGGSVSRVQTIDRMVEEGALSLR
jgi:hypothetical protein